MTNSIYKSIYNPHVFELLSNAIFDKIIQNKAYGTVLQCMTNFFATKFLANTKLSHAFCAFEKARRMETRGRHRDGTGIPADSQSRDPNFNIDPGI